MRPAQIRAAIVKRMADGRERTMGDILTALRVNRSDMALRRTIDYEIRELVRDGELVRVYLPCDAKGLRRAHGVTEQPKPEPAPTTVTEDDEEAYGRAWRELARQEGHRPAPPKMPPSNAVDKHHDTISAAIAAAGTIRRKDLIEETGLPVRAVENTIKRMREQGMIEYRVVKGVAHVSAVRA